MSARNCAGMMTSSTLPTTGRSHRALTVDVGLRWSFLDAPYQPNNQITNFQPSLYNPCAVAI